ncbi:IS110 family transposase [Clostridium sardiniense]|uniref:IS110 family transposase n=1 Tax=Clostridium sardiniense TaxID=29369 RepID=A0ABS7L3J5_CLOSR|nr:IS110 family transposase [Clostridium sardiniense]MBY0757337.1 IS110 family transposase [Clostridium sardiniense]MDQ0458509.1 transposase [Clostridium sardiniense]
MVYIGIDIGKNENVIRFINKQGKEIRKKAKLKNNYYGFKELKEIIEVLIEDNNLNSYDDILVGVESTGHYWINLQQILNRLGIKRVVMVQGTTVKTMRDLIASQKGKNDSIDSKAIAYSIKDGYYSEIMPKSIEVNSLKNMTRLRNELSESLTSIKNKIHAWLDVNNQFYLIVFQHKLTITGIKLLEKYPIPKDVLKINTREFIQDIMRDNPRIDRKKLMLYKEEVETWQYYQMDISFPSKNEIKCYIESYKTLEKTINELDKEIENLTIEIYGEQYKNLASIKGIPNLNISSLFAEIGDFKLFKNARMLQSYAGLSIRADSSATKVGESKITKKGNRRIRKNLYIITRQLIVHNTEIKKLYCYYLSLEREKENRKIEMWIATMCKILRCIYGTMKNNSNFDTSEIFKTLDFSRCNMEKFNKLYMKKDVEKLIDENTNTTNKYKK